MSGEIARFFEVIDAREHEPLLAHVRGTIHFEFVDTEAAEHWLVSVDRGRVDVRRGPGDDVDCVVRGDRRLFDQIVTGRANAMAAMLRGEIMCEGDAELLLHFERLMPGPPDGGEARPLANSGGAA